MTVHGALAAIVASLVGLGGSGCVFMSMTLVPPSPANVVTASAVGQGREVFVPSQFFDKRPTPGRCGMKKNGLGLETADILCSKPPNQWLARLVVLKLRAAGFRVVTNRRLAGSDALLLDGTLTQFFLEPDVTLLYSPEADIGLLLHASTASGLLAERRIYVKGSEPSITVHEYYFELAADDAVEQLLDRVVAAVVDLVRQFPWLGLPPEVALSANHGGAGRPP